ncbi:Fas apoptotic inhibitory molecule [Dictyocaulus viviparus]|uniref:Fas apoptotic inhibitory molecule n=1 Tax=Dictyocaulus viviparus TaxID=29172 RepID=A0A0D8X9Y0_DICVI|nr:Fas apoptotic inhibitory molecule [Dictyocaulus viviparus]
MSFTDTRDEVNTKLAAVRLSLRSKSNAVLPLVEQQEDSCNLFSRKNFRIRSKIRRTAHQYIVYRFVKMGSSYLGSKVVMVDNDIVAKWNVPLQDKASSNSTTIPSPASSLACSSPSKIPVYQIEFEHGTTTGKRSYALTASNDLNFFICYDSHDNCTIASEIADKETMEVWVNGMKIDSAVSSLFIKKKSHVTGLVTKLRPTGGARTHILQIYGLSSLQIPPLSYGGLLKLMLFNVLCKEAIHPKSLKAILGEFVADGTETHFEIGRHVCKIKATSSGRRKTGVVHHLYIDDDQIPQMTIAKT